VPRHHNGLTRPQVRLRVQHRGGCVPLRIRCQPVSSHTHAGHEAQIVPRSQQVAVQDCHLFPDDFPLEDSRIHSSRRNDESVIGRERDVCHVRGVTAIGFMCCIRPYARVSEELHLSEIVRGNNEVACAIVRASACIDVGAICALWPKTTDMPSVDAGLRGPLFVTHAA
jgi:hypothetical protein